MQYSLLMELSDVIARRDMAVLARDFILADVLTRAIWALRKGVHNAKTG